MISDKWRVAHWPHIHTNSQGHMNHNIALPTVGVVVVVVPYTNDIQFQITNAVADSSCGLTLNIDLWWMPMQNGLTRLNESRNFIATKDKKRSLFPCICQGCVSVCVFLLLLLSLLSLLFSSITIIQC